jgi:hypothetical protein
MLRCLHCALTPVLLLPQVTHGGPTTAAPDAPSSSSADHRWSCIVFVQRKVRAGRGAQLLHWLASRAAHPVCWAGAHPQRRPRWIQAASGAS